MIGPYLDACLRCITPPLLKLSFTSKRRRSLNSFDSLCQIGSCKWEMEGEIGRNGERGRWRGGAACIQ